VKQELSKMGKKLRIVMKIHFTYDVISTSMEKRSQRNNDVSTSSSFSMNPYINDWKQNIYFDDVEDAS